ncbi:MAG TPA: TetR/AcrR family transcriptional regulator C-terminal domain-containing protein [Rubrobacteraceae bacterium]|jgi:TetR/AcrR family tetracycline transcriptional repressor|nr:TetR/AcrR family transcriptional regulator C-terminal domain-containing protein [Rubrobacteraceae bacterium]
MRRAGRPRSGEEPLTRERILEAALSLVDAEGMEALSMRRLAKELGVDPMAIYHHVPNKRALLWGLIGEVFSGMRVPEERGDPADWRERVRAWARAFRDVARTHPKLVPHLASYPEAAAEATLESTEELYAAFEAAGMQPREIVGAVGVVVDYVNGFALAEASGALGEPDEQKEMIEMLDARPPGELPAMRRTFEALAEEDLGTDFEFGLEVVLAGLEAVTERRGE